MYHNLHILLLHVLYAQHNRIEFHKWSEIFSGYAASYQCRVRAAAELFKAKCRVMYGTW